MGDLMLFIFNTENAIIVKGEWYKQISMNFIFYKPLVLFWDKYKPAITRVIIFLI